MYILLVSLSVVGKRVTLAAGLNLCTIKSMAKVAVFQLLETFKWDVWRELNYSSHKIYFVCTHIITHHWY
jgi:hypothetical protein